MRILCCLLFLATPLVAYSETRPNIVWIVSDDLSPELGCYGYPGVETPHLDRLASEGARFDLAFSTAPVCSSSRTAFQTGRYQISFWGHHHDTRDKRPLPPEIDTVTGLMQNAGYFVSNGRGTVEDSRRLAKSHFNWEYDPREFFDGTDWSQRKAGQPFFAQVQLREPHRVFVDNEKIYEEVPIPKCYPEHPVTRADWSDYLASIEELDRKVGAVLGRLDSEGLAENTLVLFFGDHGRPHVRGKQWLYDGGLHVPLIARWPGRITPGTVDERLVSLLDLVPTTLAAAGVRAPADLPGWDLLDPAWKGHDMLFAARDRCGDAPDRIRSVRTRDFKYIRNFRPELPYMQHSGYKRGAYPVDTLMRVLHEKGEWTSPFMAETRPEEELYDLRKDPDELTNLAGDPAHSGMLEELRGAVAQWVVDVDDQGRIEEGLTVDLDAVMKEKRRAYENRLKKYGLAPDVSDIEFLEWWKRELEVK